MKQNHPISPPPNSSIPYMGEDDQVAVEVEPCLPTHKFPFLPTAPLSPDHPSGMATPPLHALASVPFKWEELPGKPRPCTDIIVRPEPAAKCLEPPPCSKMAKMPSPTTVLDGPYNLGRPKFSSFRIFREKQRSFDSSSGGGSPQSSVDVLVGKKNNGRLKMSRLFGRSLRKKDGDDGGSFGFSSPSSFAGFDDCVFAEGKMTRNGSFSSFPEPAPPPPLRGEPELKS